MKILVINGPNINMLGIREKDLYGEKSYADLLEFIRESAAELQIEVECFQSNYEGAIIDKIQEAYGKFQAIVINPAAYTHSSIAIMDALKAVKLPAIEVHISNVNEREDFRKISYTALACQETISGKGFQGYKEALEKLKGVGIRE
jgi:3-dehydroquinate dehydratase-2